MLDSHSLEIILGELDTIHDFSAFLRAKEDAIGKLDILCYCGEQDLLGNYFRNYDETAKKHFIGTNDDTVNSVMIGEGEWRSFTESDVYERRKRANRRSYLWDTIIEKTARNAIAGTLMGNGDVFQGKSAIHEMAKEPRFMRRALAERIINAIREFPAEDGQITRHIAFMPSHERGKAYLFMQLWHPNIIDYDNEYRPVRQGLLEVACGVAALKFPHLRKVIGIAIDAARHSKTNSEDFILLERSRMTARQEEYYRGQNKHWQFFETDQVRQGEFTVKEFPDEETLSAP